jgi:hypothetical protein
MLPPKLHSDMLDLRHSRNLRKQMPWLCRLAAVVWEVWLRHSDLRLALCDARKEINDLKAELAALRSELEAFRHVA